MASKKPAAKKPASKRVAGERVPSKEAATPSKASAAGAVVVALLRGINVGGRRKVPMAELRDLAEQIGWSDVRTYVQSGNVVFRLNGKATAAGLSDAETALESALQEHFGFEVPVIMRSGADWRRIHRSCPFPGAAAERPKLLHVGVTKGALPKSFTPASVSSACRDGEQVAVAEGCLWIDYAGGVARSKLTPAVLDRAAATPVTCRNWHTVEALQALITSVEAGA